MRKFTPFVMALALIAALVCTPHAHANALGAKIFQQPGINIIGPGCSTAFYLNPLCKPCGIGMKSSGTVTNVADWVSTTAYAPGTWVTFQGDATNPNRSFWMALSSNTNSPPTGSGGVSTNPNWEESPPPISPATYMLVQNPPGLGGGAGLPAWASMGDLPDADPNDPNVCTTAQWAAKWGCATSACNQTADNAAMVAYLNNDFGFTNTNNNYAPAHIYYLSLTGSNAACGSGGGCPDDPAHPYASLGPVETLLNTVTASFTGTVTTVAGSPVITVTCPCTGALVRSSKVGAATTGIQNLYVIKQLTAPTGTGPTTAGTYMLTGNAASSHVNEAMTAGVQPGGAIIIRGGNWPTCGVAPCFCTNPGTAGNPSWYPTGSPGHTLLFMGFPGEKVVLNSGCGSGAIFNYVNVYNPGTAKCCVRISQLQMVGAIWKQQDAITVANMWDIEVDHTEYANFDKYAFGSGTNNAYVHNNVCHDIWAHCRYDDWNSGCPQLFMTTGGTDTNFPMMDQQAVSATPGTAACFPSYDSRTIGNVMVDSGYEGFDVIHLNAWQLHSTVLENVVDYGGYPLAVDTGQYGMRVSGNLFFDNTAQCALYFLYANHFALMNSTAGSSTVFLTPFPHFDGFNSSGWAPAPGDYINAIGVPRLTTLPVGGSGTGNYTLSQAATVSETAVPITEGAVNGSPGSTTLRYDSFDHNVCFQGNPSDNIYGKSPGIAFEIYEQTGNGAIRNLSITDNVFINSDNGITTGSIPILYNLGTYESQQNYTQLPNTGNFPNSHTITRNTFWNNGSFVCSGNSCRVMSNDGADASGTIPSGTSFTFGQFSVYYPGNTFALSNPFPMTATSNGAFNSYDQTPQLFDFGDPLKGGYNLR
jgi:hypothetical protein